MKRTIALLGLLVLLVFASSASADTLYPFPPGENHTPGYSTTYLHIGNAEDYAAHHGGAQADATARLGYVCGGACWSGTSHYYRFDNTSVYVIVVIYNPNTRRYCQYHAYIVGSDSAPRYNVAFATKTFLDGCSGW